MGSLVTRVGGNRMDLMMIQAIESDDLETVIQLLQKGYSVNKPKVGYPPLFLTITYERREIFDYLFTLPDINLNVENDTALHLSLKCSTTYFTRRLLDAGASLDKPIHRNLLHIATNNNNKEMVELLIQHGANIDYIDIIGVTPLDLAVENDNEELVCLFLYYNSQTEVIDNNMSTFMYSMVCNCSKEIQSILIDYVSDINNLCDEMSNLFFGVKYSSPVIVDIINRGASINHITDDHNVISLLLSYPCSSDIFKIVWDKFDYNMWNKTFSKSVILRILEHQSLSDHLWKDYLEIIIFSNQIEEVLHSHYCSHFKDSDYLISDIYMNYTKRGFAEDVILPVISTLLSYGTKVYAQDLHRIYNILGSTNYKSEVLELLLFMDIIIEFDDRFEFNFIRLKYAILEKIEDFLNDLYDQILSDVLIISLKDVVQYVAIPCSLKEHLLRLEDVKISEVIGNAEVIPSLLELARNRVKDSICFDFNIHSSSQFRTMIHNLSLPNICKDILCFEKPLYRI